MKYGDNQVASTVFSRVAFVGGEYGRVGKLD